MNRSQDQLETLWDALLSRQTELILKAFNSLDPESKKAVLIHLKRMSTETGWHPEQADSAKSAFKALKDYDLPHRSTTL